jgi:hypothetical protein
MDSHDRMVTLISILEDIDPEHGDTHVLDNFLDEYAPANYYLDEDFDVFAFRDAHADEYANYLEYYINN